MLRKIVYCLVLTIANEAFGFSYWPACNDACLRYSNGEYAYEDCSLLDDETCRFCRSQVCSIEEPAGASSLADLRSQVEKICKPLDESVEIIDCTAAEDATITCDVTCKDGFSPSAYVRSNIPNWSFGSQPHFQVVCGVGREVTEEQNAKFCVPDMNRREDSLSEYVPKIKRSRSSSFCSAACARGLSGSYVYGGCKGLSMSVRACLMCRMSGFCASGKAFVGG